VKDVFVGADKGNVMNNQHGGDLDHSPVHLLHRAYQSAGDVFQAEVEIAALTPRQLAVLLAIAENEGLSQTGVVERTGVDRSTVADMIRRLQRKGLLQRRRTKADARAYALKLTGEGRRVLQAAEPLSKSVDARVLNALPGGRREAFIDALRAIVAALEPKRA
jgi:DNA-binding MarR family transcriptional regulator